MTVTTDQVFSLIARQNEVIKRVKNGGLTIENALAGTQGILEGSYPTKLNSQIPSWYVWPADQLAWVLQLNSERGWGFQDSDIPSIVSMEHRPTRNSVLMLAVTLPGEKSLQRTFDELWHSIKISGFTKWRWSQLKSDADQLRYAPGYEQSPGIRWVWFDATAYQGLSPKAALEKAKADGVRLAGTEILMAALLFPSWVASFNGSRSPLPNLSGLQFKLEKDTDWNYALCLDRFNGVVQLNLDANWSDKADSYCSSPVVREC